MPKKLGRKDMFLQGIDSDGESIVLFSVSAIFFDLPLFPAPKKLKVLYMKNQKEFGKMKITPYALFSFFARSDVLGKAST